MKNFLSKLFLFFIVLYAIQFVYVHFYPYRSPVIVNQLSGADILFFGDSSVYYTSKNDVDKRSTPKILNDEIKKDGHQVIELSSAAWGSNIFTAYSAFLKQQGYVPQYVIVPINLRSFSVSFDLNPEFQFSDDINYFTFYHTPLYPFLGFIDNFSRADINQQYEKLYRDTTIYNGTVPIGKASDFENTPSSMPYQTKLKNLITLFYFSAIPRNHRKMEALYQMIDVYKNTNTKVIFYITPVDYQTGEKYFGQQFDQRIAANTQMITEELQKRNAIVLDLSRTLPTEDFTWYEDHGLNNYVNEHINNYGKQFIVQKLVDIVDPVAKLSKR